MSHHHHNVSLRFRAETEEKNFILENCQLPERKLDQIRQLDKLTFLEF